MHLKNVYASGKSEKSLVLAHKASGRDLYIYMVSFAYVVSSTSEKHYDE